MENLYPAYVCGRRISSWGKAKEAEAEFRNFVDYPGIVITDPMGALARKEIAKVNR